MFVRAKAWQTLLRDRPTYKDVLYSAGEGYLLNNFLPFRLGELGRAFLLSRKSGLQFGEIIPTIVIERIVDLAFSAVILCLPYPFCHLCLVLQARNGSDILLAQLWSLACR